MFVRLLSFFVLPLISLRQSCVSSADAIRALEVVYSNLMNMHALLPDLGFQDRAADLVNRYGPILREERGKRIRTRKKARTHTDTPERERELLQC